MPTLLDLLDVEIPITVIIKSIVNVVNKNISGKEYSFLCMLPGMPNLVEPFLKQGLNPKKLWF